jgi:hypothetical protein
MSHKISADAFSKTIEKLTKEAHPVVECRGCKQQFMLTDRPIHLNRKLYLKSCEEHKP